MRSTETELRRQADDLVALLTPVVKAFFTDTGFEVSNLGVQVFGGHGYIREHGMEQLVRDARIGQLYEGTNGVQAMDLAGRKLPMADGTMIQAFLGPVRDYLQAKAGETNLLEFTRPLAEAAERLERAAHNLLLRAADNPAETGAGAADFLQLFGLTALAYEWARMAEIGLKRRDGEEALFYDTKVRTARFFMQRILPRSEAHYRAIEAGSDCMMDFDDRAW